MNSNDSGRIVSIDLLRGLVIMIMALDHVRDFWSPTAFMPEDLTQTTPGWFFTRWITHFCAPVFVFLAGTSARLYGARQTSRKALAWFLLTRGAWLIVLELLIVVPSWQWGWSFLFVQVIWALGCSMIVLAGLIWLPMPAIAGFGFALVLGHHLLDGIEAAQWGSLAWLWNVLHVPGWIALKGQFGVWVQYPLIPWLGVMALGYVAGGWYLGPASVRHQRLLGWGVAAIALFLLLRLTNFYGDPAQWSPQATALGQIMAVLNTTKYPPSLLFLCMTLGPAMLVLIVLERASGGFWDRVLVFGRVPLFFYLIHLPVIHAGSTIFLVAVYGREFGFFSGSPDTWPPAYEPQLWLTWLVWLATLALLYWPCKWYAELKFRLRKPWMSYL